MSESDERENPVSEWEWGRLLHYTPGDLEVTMLGVDENGCLTFETTDEATVLVWTLGPDVNGQIAWQAMVSGGADVVHSTGTHTAPPFATLDEVHDRIRSQMAQAEEVSHAPSA